MRLIPYVLYSRRSALGTLLSQPLHLLCRLFSCRRTPLQSGQLNVIYVNRIVAVTKKIIITNATNKVNRTTGCISSSTFQKPSVIILHSHSLIHITEFLFKLFWSIPDFGHIGNNPVFSPPGFLFLAFLMFTVRSFFFEN